MRLVESRTTLFVAYAALSIFAFIALFPIALLVFNSLKPAAQIVQNPLGLPDRIRW
jgi:raffinose/stachyose/melibiose transport system permease protein